MKRKLIIPKGVLDVGIPEFDCGDTNCMVYKDRPLSPEFCPGLVCDDCVFCTDVLPPSMDLSEITLELQQ